MTIMVGYAIFQQRALANKRGPYCFVASALVTLYVYPLVFWEWSPWIYNWVNLLGVWRLIVLLAVEPPTDLRLEPFKFNNDIALNAMLAYLVNLVLLLNPALFLPESAIFLWHTVIWILYFILGSLHQRAITQTKDILIGEEKDLGRLV